MTVLSFSTAALDDLQGIHIYSMETWGAAQADRYLAMLRETCHKLVDIPHLGQALPEFGQNLHMMTCGSHVIFYSTAPDLLIVVAILHTRMDALRHISDRVQ